MDRSWALDILGTLSYSDNYDGNPDNISQWSDGFYLGDYPFTGKQPDHADVTLHLWVELPVCSGECCGIIHNSLVRDTPYRESHRDLYDVYFEGMVHHQDLLTKRNQRSGYSSEDIRQEHE